MKKEEILIALEVTGGSESVTIGPCSVLAELTGVEFNVTITIPYDVTELYYEAVGKDGKTLLKDWHDFYGEAENEDYTACLQEIAQLLRTPALRLANDGKTMNMKIRGS